MDARVVGGRVTLLLMVALLACDIAPSRSPAAEKSEAPIVSARVAADVSTAPVLEAPPESSPSRVVLVTIDGVRWQDVFAGATDERALDSEPMMPSLHRLVGERGAALGGPGCAHDVRASGPSFVSLPGYLEMFTGKATGCTHNACPPVDTMTVIDEVRAAVDRDVDVAVFASWGKYARAVARDRKAIVLSTGARAAHVDAVKEDTELRSSIEEGARFAGYPGWGDYRPDVYTARIALRYLEAKAPRMLVVGLGDADEHAHRRDIAGYRRAVRRSDDFLAELDRTLARMGAPGRETAVHVNTDQRRSHSMHAHGPGFPESQRVCFAAFGAGIARRGVTCAPSPIRLAHLAGAVRALFALASDVAPGPLAGEIIDRSSAPHTN